MVDLVHLEARVCRVAEQTPAIVPELGLALLAGIIEIEFQESMTGGEAIISVDGVITTERGNFRMCLLRAD